MVVPVGVVGVTAVEGTFGTLPVGPELFGMYVPPLVCVVLFTLLEFGVL